MQSRSAQIGPFTVVGNGTTIGNNTKISNSVVGEGCNIGSKVSIEGSYIWHNVTIEDGCTLRHAIVCDGVIIKSGAVLEPGVVLSFKVCTVIYLVSCLSFHIAEIYLFCFVSFNVCFELVVIGGHYVIHRSNFLLSLLIFPFSLVGFCAQCPFVYIFFYF